MNQLKKTSLTLLLYLSLFSCLPEQKQKTAPDSPVHTLIFMDKTQSVNIDKAFVQQKYQQILSDIVEQNIRQRGDKVEVYYIHENTSKARALSLTCRTEKENTEAMNATDREGAQTTFELLLGREKIMMLRQLNLKLATQNISTSQRYTDIWSALEVVSKAAETGAEVSAYFLSDMIESMAGVGRRDFHKNPPKNNAEAEDWAVADAKILKYALAGSKIALALPFEPTSSTTENNPSITHYWAFLLQELGAEEVTEK